MLRAYANYKITEHAESYHSSVAIALIEVQGIESMPSALKRLAEMGYDMAPSLDALTKAVDEQRKRKALEASVADLAKKSGE